MIAGENEYATTIGWHSSEVHVPSATVIVRVPNDVLTSTVLAAAVGDPSKSTDATAEATNFGFTGFTSLSQPRDRRSAASTDV